MVGGDGFGFAKRADGTHFKIVQSGVTVIEDDVEIQTLTSVDRATVGETRVRRGAKIDSLVQVGHACVVGEDNIICAQTGLAGSSVLEKNVLLAGQVGVGGHLTIHDDAVVYAQSGIGGDVAAGARDLGIAGIRRQRVAARDHRLPEAAGTAEDGAGIEEERSMSSKRNEQVEYAQLIASGAPGRLPEREVPEQPGCAGAAHPVGVSGAAGAFPPGEDPRHRGVFRVGADPRGRRSAGAVLSTRPGRWRGC